VLGGANIRRMPKRRRKGAPYRPRPRTAPVIESDAQIAAWLAQEDARVASYIRDHGWSIEYVIGDPPRQQTSIAYTVGLFGMGHPELVLLGASTDTACGVLNEVGRRVKAGENLTVGALLTFDEWPHRITVEEVPNPGAILFGANRHYQRPAAASVPALQLTHDDVHGRFPWDDKYCIPAWIQPRPGTYTA
jgi:hypothetical protein